MFRSLLMVVMLGLTTPLVRGEELTSSSVGSVSQVTNQVSLGLGRLGARDYLNGSMVTFHPEIFIKEVKILPLQELMLYDSIVTEGGTRSGLDRFNWDLVPHGKGNLRWYVESLYPLTNVGPYTDVLTTGFGYSRLF